MALATIGPGLVMPSIQPWSEGASTATASTSSNSAGQASASIAQDSYGAASTSASSTQSGVVKAKSFLSNIWDELFAPVLGGLWSMLSSLLHGL